MVYRGFISGCGEMGVTCTHVTDVTNVTHPVYLLHRISDTRGASRACDFDTRCALLDQLNEIPKAVRLRWSTTGKPLVAEAALTAREVAERAQKVDLTQVRPKRLHEVEL